MFPAHINKKSIKKLSNDEFVFEVSAAPRAETVRRDLEEEEMLQK